MSETQPDPTPDETPDETPEEGTSGRFAVYNETLGRFVGPVVAKRPSKAAVAQLVAKDHKATVRQV